MSALDPFWALDLLALAGFVCWLVAVWCVVALWRDDDSDNAA